MLSVLSMTVIPVFACIFYIWLNLPELWCHSSTHTVFFFLIQLARDLLHPSLDEEKKKHKKKRLVQSPNSYFMDVKCPGEISNFNSFPKENFSKGLLIEFL